MHKMQTFLGANRTITEHGLSFFLFQVGNEVFKSRLQIPTDRRLMILRLKTLKM